MDALTDVNYRFMVDRILALGAGGRVLDYGCGAGLVVQAAHDAGADIVGVDSFYEAGDGHAKAGAAGRLGSLVLPMPEGRIPFPAASFDLIVSNQVLEHVEDLDAVLAEMVRVLKPGGRLLHAFPTIEALREGHIGIPLAHKLPRGRLRFLYTCLCRRLGMGFFKADESVGDYARAKLDWLDRFTVYRSCREIHAAFRRHGLVARHDELAYVRYRLRHRALRRLAVLLAPVTQALFRRLGFVVLDVGAL